MSCIYSENDIALFVEGDLATEKAAEVQEHLEFCRECGALAEDLQQTQAAFKSLRQDTVSAAALSSVRARVLSEIRELRVKPAWGRWIYATAGAMFVALIGLGITWQSPVPPPPIQQVVVSVPTLPPSTPEVPTPAPLLVRRGGGAEGAPGRSGTPKVTARPTTPAALEAQPPLLTKEGSKTEVHQTVLKLFTDDPNIVIYWLIDQTGGTL